MAPQPKPTEKANKRSQILDEVLRDHGGALRRQAKVHSQKPENAGDALDDACVLFLRCYDGPPGLDALRYLMVVVKTAAWAIDRRRRGLEVHEGPMAFNADLKMDPLAAVPDPGEEPEEQYVRLEELRRRAALLAVLKPDERAAIVLHAAGYSYREIGQRQGWSRRKVDRCILEGRRRLGPLIGSSGRKS